MRMRLGLPLQEDSTTGYLNSRQKAVKSSLVMSQVSLPRYSQSLAQTGLTNKYIGWLCATGWQCAIVSIAFLAGTIIQGLIVLNDESYLFQRWHGTLLVIAITAFSIFFNTFLAKRLPMVEALILILHIVGLFAIIIPLWVMAPRASAKSVFTQFNNDGGWNSLGSSTLVGFSGTITAMIGYDCAVHMCIYSSHKKKHSKDVS